MSVNEKSKIVSKELRVVISAQDSEVATKVVLNYNGSMSMKNDVQTQKKVSDDDEDIQLVCRTPSKRILAKKDNHNLALSGRKNSPLSIQKRNSSSVATNVDASKKERVGKTDRYVRRGKLTDRDISILLNESCSSSEGHTDEEESNGEEGEVWTVAGKNSVRASPCDSPGNDVQTGQSPSLTPASKSVRRSLNLDSPKSSPKSTRKQKVSPIKLRRKIQGADAGSQSPKAGITIHNTDDRCRSLRDRDELKRPSWLDDDHEFEISPPKSNFTSPSSNRTRYSKRFLDSPRSAASPSKSIPNSPKTPSLRKQVLQANTPPVSLLKKKNLNGKFCTPQKAQDENISTPPRSTPKRVQIALDDGTDDDFEEKDDEDYELPKRRRRLPKERRSSVVTPSKSSVKKRLTLTPAKNQPPSTPTSVKRIGHGFLTPVVAERGCKILANTPTSRAAAVVGGDEIDMARAQLHVSTVPTSLPCREKEFNNICNFIVRKIQDQAGGCMYISGVPGTGKTATVHAVVRQLQGKAIEKKLSPFDFVEVNGLRLTEPRQAYVRILQGLQGDKLTADQAHRKLEKTFCGKPKKPTVLLVDELDYLCNRRQDVIYNILEWSCQHSSKLIVLTIANTMDLPERTLKGKVTSRMGLTRLVFQPYTYQQLQEIVMNRLAGSSTFHPDAVQLVARKVAAVSGDARRALDICRRSTELLKKDDKQQVVSVLHVEKSLSQIFTGARVLAIRNCSLMWQYVLRAIRDETLRTGLEETNVKQVYNHLQAICTLEGCVVPTVGEVLSICCSLSSYGLIVAEKGRTDMNKKLSLNVSSDDIHYALSCC